MRRLEQGHALQRGAQLGGLGPEGVGVAEQHDPGQSVLHDLPGRLDHPVVVAFGQNHRLQILAGICLNLIN